MLLILPCFARYYERRLKSTTQAYIHVITMHRLGMLTADGNKRNFSCLSEVGDIRSQYLTTVPTACVQI